MKVLAELRQLSHWSPVYGRSPMTIKMSAAIPAGPLLALLDDQDDMTCGSAVNALSELTPGVSSDIFLRFLDSERNYPRMCAIRALGRRGAQAPIARLLDFLTTPGRSNQGERSAAVAASPSIGAPA